jgi:hypothetical protein
MKIDRHNYEECFILYWDNELTAVQKQVVERFVAENADLQEEFKIFGETRFTPDSNIQIGEKEFLQNHSFINITSYEDQLLDYIDDELSTDENKKVEKFAAQYPAIQKELALLQKTKLEPEEISFPDKSVLYRRDEKVRVVSIFWRRVAVAAAIILIAGLVTFRLVNNKTVNEDSIAKNNELKTQKPVTTQPVVTQPTAVPEKDQSANDLVKTTDQKSLIATTRVAGKEDKKQVLKTKFDKPAENLIAAHQPENKNNLPKEGNRNITSQEGQNTETQPVIASVDMPNVKRDDARVAKLDSEKTNDPETDGVTKSPTPTFAIYNGSEEKQKGGLKEFLRKTTRVFERRTKIQTTTEDNKLLLGAFAVSLK